jgi:hypothetical protein
VGLIVGASFTPTATPPTLCSGNTSVLASNLLASGFAATAITYSASVASSPTVLTNAGTAVVAATSCYYCPLDDAGWANIPIGFNYNFFGASYSSLNVGTNSNIQFGTYNGTPNGGLGDYIFANTLPNNTEPLNMIAGAAVDLNPGLGGILRYWTEGIAPTRMFVVEWNAVPGYANNGSNTAQIKLFETTPLFPPIDLFACNTAMPSFVAAILFWMYRNLILNESRSVSSLLISGDFF